MQAVIATGGKQYRVVPGQVIHVEKIAAAAKGSRVEFTSVLLVNRDGHVTASPSDLTGTRVIGEVVAEGKGPKIRVVKFKRRKNYRRTRGHRQRVTSVRITAIEG